MEFFRIKRDIPFMRYALIFNVISLITFLVAVAVALDARTAPRRGFHRRHRDGSFLPAAARSQPDPRAHGEGRVRGPERAEFRHLARRAGPAAGQGGPDQRQAIGTGHAGIEAARRHRGAAPCRIRRPAGRQGAARERRARAAVRFHRHRALPVAALRVEVRGVGDRRQPARRRDHSRLSSRSSSGSSRCRCSRRCSRSSATR